MKRPSFALSLRFKLFAAFAIVALTPLLMLAVVNGRDTREILVKDANRSLLMVANEASLALDDFIRASQNELATEARLPVIHEYLALPPESRRASTEELRLLAFLVSLEGKNNYIRSYGILDTNGVNLLDSHQPNRGQSEADKDYFRAFRASGLDYEPFVSAVQFRPDTDDASLYFSLPLVNEAGQTTGYIRAEYDAVVLQDILTEYNDKAGPASFGVLFDEHFIHLAHGVEPGVNYVPIGAFPEDVEAELTANGRLRPILDNELYPMQLDELMSGLSDAASQPFFKATDVATGDLINHVAVVFLNRQPWLVAIFQPQEIFLAPVEKQAEQTALLVAMMAGVIVLVAYLFGGVLVRPLKSLTEMVTQFAEGDLMARTDVKTNDEIGILASHFNDMAERVGLLLTGLESRTQALQQEAAEHKETEIRLRQQRRFLRQVTNINPSFIFAKDRDGRFVMVNQAFADTYNTTIENMIGKTDADFNPDPIKVERFRRDDLQVFESGEELFIPEQRNVNDQGEERWWQTLKRPLRSEDGTVSEVLTIVTEITERKQNEEALLVARDRALEASRVRSEILAKANHELQTPLGAILGYAEMIESGYFGEINEKQQEALEKIIGRTNHLTALIQNLLAQANLEAKKDAYAPTSFTPAELLHEMHQNLDADAEEKGLALTSEIDKNFPGILMGAPKKLQQILTNLVGNGLKFTDQGFVHVRLFQPDVETWAIAVSDSGPGIPADAFEYIFEPFRQVDGSITRKHQGFGLGLSLVKELALTMEGDVYLASEVGKGSTFTVILPYTPHLELVP